jgi:transposase
LDSGDWSWRRIQLQGAIAKAASTLRFAAAVHIDGAVRHWITETGRGAGFNCKVELVRFCGQGLSEIEGRIPMQNKSSKHARRYDADFKRNAVALVEGGRTIMEVCRDLGVSHWSLSRWVNDTRHGKSLDEPKTIGSETSEQRELRRLRQENAYLRRQRDILKKACSILSTEMPPSDLP